MVNRRFAAILALGMLFGTAWAPSAKCSTEFEVSLPPSLYQGPITGRLLLMISRSDEPEVRYQVGWVGSPPVFGIDVDGLTPGHPAIIDDHVPGYPLHSLSELPSGDYYVQAVLNVYTQFHRADGHIIWAHMDQWEGQQFNRSPGNLFSKVQKIRLERTNQAKIRISLTEVIPPIEVPPDTVWVKRVKIQSAILTRFWGHPMYLGAVVLLPKGYDENPSTRYPVIYQQGHFSLDAPFSFQTVETPETDEQRLYRLASGVETGYQFYKAWSSENFPRVIAVTFLHPTPYYDDSYAVDSANNGPYGTAIMTELIPYLEKTFRVLTRPYARLLTGGSTGGWESLALQLLHPDFFGGTWTLYPDPVDFRRFPVVDIYNDSNMFVLGPKEVPNWARQDWISSERIFARANDGQPVATVRQASDIEAALGSKDRSGGQLAIWEATFGPVGNDGYPRHLFDRMTGEIDHEVARYMRDHGYDLRYFAETNWDRIGSRLSGKVNLYCGDMDNFYLNLSVYLFAQFLQKVDRKDTQDILEYGRPLKGHGWQPMTNAALVAQMAERVSENAPAGKGIAGLVR